MNSDDDSQPENFDEDGSDEEVYFEEVEVNVVEKQILNKKTPPIMWEYEKTNIITKRKIQIDNGSVARGVSKEALRNVHSSYEIALLEFENGMIDYTVKRVMDGGYYELWKHNDFEYFPK